MARIRFKPLRSSEKNDDVAAPSVAKNDKKSISSSKSSSRTSWFDYATQDTWGWEIFGLLVCLMTLISIFAVLFSYNQKPLPHVAAGISLNTIISLLATLARSATIFVAASIIAQQKWLRFVPSSRQLRDVDTYDTATRGPLGSLFLLASLRINFPTAVAALIVVLALGFEPFVQQSIRFPSRPYRLGGYSPLLQTTNSVSFSNSSSSLTKSVLVDSTMRQSLYATTVTPILPTCLTNTCNWSHYTTVAICSSCQDALNTTTISSLDNIAFQMYASGDYFSNADTFIELTLHNVYNATASTNYNVSFGSGFSNYTFNADFTAWTELAASGRTWAEVLYPEEVVFDLSNTTGVPYLSYVPLRTLGYFKLNLSADGLNLSLSSAQICTVTPCAQNMSTFMANGTLNSKILDQNYGYFALYTSGRTGIVSQWTAKLGSEVFNSTPPGIAGSATDHDFANDILTQLYDTFNNLFGSTTRVLHAGEQISVSDEPGLPLPGDPHKAGLLEAPSDVMQFISDVPNSTANIAQGLTNFIVKGNGSKLIGGEGFTTELFVDVHWPWLSFPLALVLICFLILLVTIFQTRRARIPIWKSSPFPLIFDYNHDELSMVTTRSATDSSEQGSTLTTTNQDDQVEQGITTGADTVAARDTMVSRNEHQATKAGANGKWVNSLQHHEKLAGQIEIRLVARDKKWSFEKTIDIF